jgi:hypothetical protein
MMRQIPSYTEILAVNLIKLINIMTNYGKWELYLISPSDACAAEHLAVSEIIVTFQRYSLIFWPYTYTKQTQTVWDENLQAVWF